MSFAPKERNVVPESTEDIQKTNESIQNLIAVLRITDTIEVNDETIKKNSETGTLNDGIVVYY